MGVVLRHIVRALSIVTDRYEISCYSLEDGPFERLVKVSVSHPLEHAAFLICVSFLTSVSRIIQECPPPLPPLPRKTPSNSPTSPSYLEHTNHPTNPATTQAPSPHLLEHPPSRLNPRHRLSPPNAKRRRKPRQRFDLVRLRIRTS